MTPAIHVKLLANPPHTLNNAHYFISLSDYFRVVPHLTSEEQLVVFLLTRVSYLTLTEIDHCTLLPNAESVVVKLLEKGILIQTPIQKTDDEDELFYELNVDRIKSLPKYAPLDDVD